MLSYAVSMACIGKVMTPAAANALRESKFRNVELSWNFYAGETPEISESKKLTAELIREGVITPASIHLPFGGIWEPSALSEEKRKCAVACFRNMIEEHRELAGPNWTLHPSGEPALSEHPDRVKQVCKSIEELLPLAQELNASINVEFLPRNCICNSVEEIQYIVNQFDPANVGICFDVNHVMNRAGELPEMIHELAPRIKSFHINDYDNVDETHWAAGIGCINWIPVMREIKAIPHDVLLIHETFWFLKYPDHPVDPVWQLKLLEKSTWFMENCEKLMPEMEKFQIPGN